MRRVILRLAAGQSYRAVVKGEGHRGKIVSEAIIGQEARILKATKQAPPDGSTHWSTRKLAGHLGVSHSWVARVWARAGMVFCEILALKPRSRVRLS